MFKTITILLFGAKVHTFSETAILFLAFLRYFLAITKKDAHNESVAGISFQQV